MNEAEALTRHQEHQAAAHQRMIDLEAELESGFEETLPKLRDALLFGQKIYLNDSPWLDSEDVEQAIYNNELAARKMQHALLASVKCERIAGRELRQAWELGVKQLLNDFKDALFAAYCAGELSWDEA